MKYAFKTNMSADELKTLSAKAYNKYQNFTLSYKLKNTASVKKYIGGNGYVIIPTLTNAEYVTYVKLMKEISREPLPIEDIEEFLFSGDDSLYALYITKTIKFLNDYNKFDIVQALMGDADYTALFLTPSKDVDKIERKMKKYIKDIQNGFFTRKSIERNVLFLGSIINLLKSFEENSDE